jgi:PilZ domain-containing protein
MKSGHESEIAKRKEKSMAQVFEGTENKTAASILGNPEDASTAPAANAMVYVYGHGPTRNPFYEEARILHTSPLGALLVLSAPVNRGQKLLLISAAGQEPAEAQVVRTGTLGTQMFEVEISLSSPRPDFWKLLPSSSKKEAGAERRRSPRVRLPRGMAIEWQGARRHDISRVSSLSLGGLFIEATEPEPAGDTLLVQFDLPSGPVRGQAVVRRSVAGQGMGVEFKELPENSRTRLGELLQKLLGNVPSARS